MNIHVISCYNVPSFYGNGNPLHYKEMTELCVKSFMRNLKNLDAVITLSKKVTSYHDMFKDVFFKLKTLWKPRVTNILYTDADTLCLKSTDIFGKINGFQLFCQQDNMKVFKGVPEELYKHLTPWYMASVRYFSSDMDSCLWDVGEALVNKWINTWAYECIVYNSMFHAQPDELKLNLPQYNCQWSTDFPPSVQIAQANIVHLHSTRGSGRTLERMRKLL